jgi:hypothetical protein
VHRVNAVLEAAVFRLKPTDGFVVEGFLIAVALAQRGDDPVQDILREGQLSEQLREAFSEHLLARVRLRAAALVPLVVVVDILLLLQFPDHRTAAVAAEQGHHLGHPSPGDSLAAGNLGLIVNLAGLEEGLPLRGLAEKLDNTGRPGRLGRLAVPVLGRERIDDAFGRHPPRQGADVAIFEGPFGPRAISTVCSIRNQISGSAQPRPRRKLLRAPLPLCRRPFLCLSARISGLRSARSSPCIRHSKILSEGTA